MPEAICDKRKDKKGHKYTQQGVVCAHKGVSTLSSQGEVYTPVYVFIVHSGVHVYTQKILSTLKISFLHSAVHVYTHESKSTPRSPCLHSRIDVYTQESMSTRKKFASILSTCRHCLLTLSRDLPETALQVERLCMKN